MIDETKQEWGDGGGGEVLRPDMLADPIPITVGFWAHLMLRVTASLTYLMSASDASSSRGS